MAEYPPRTPITLVGMMGSGKSTVGRLLAARLGCSFHDSDAVIEAKTGKTIRALFAEDGEPAFRALEARVILELLGSGSAVLSLGGGALTTSATADAVLEQSLCVWLDASIATLTERLSQDTTRPLLQNADLAATLNRLMHTRLPLYRRAHLHVQTDGMDAEAIATHIQHALEGTIHAD